MTDEHGLIQCKKCGGYFELDELILFEDEMICGECLEDMEEME